MNKAQTIYTQAGEAATSLASNLTAHDLQVKRLEAFNLQNQDPLDYPAWESAFNRKRDRAMQLAQAESDEFARLAAQKAASEIAAAKAAPAQTT